MEFISFYTLNSVAGSGHVKYQENPLACKLHGNSAWKIISFYLLHSQLYKPVPKGRKNISKISWGLFYVFYMATPSHTTESVGTC